MKRMTFASMAALRAALMNLAEKPPGKDVIYEGELDENK